MREPKPNASTGSTSEVRFFKSILLISILGNSGILCFQFLSFNLELTISVLILSGIYGLALLAQRYIRPEIGYHIFLLGSLLVYQGIPMFTSLSFFAGMLLFPILILIAINLFRDRSISFLYALLSVAPLVTALYWYLYPVAQSGPFQ